MFNERSRTSLLIKHAVSTAPTLRRERRSCTCRSTHPSACFPRSLVCQLAFRRATAPRYRTVYLHHKTIENVSDVGPACVYLLRRERNTEVRGGRLTRKAVCRHPASEGRVQFIVATSAAMLSIRIHNSCRGVIRASTQNGRGRDFRTRVPQCTSPQRPSRDNRREIWRIAASAADGSQPEKAMADSGASKILLLGALFGGWCALAMCTMEAAPPARCRAPPAHNAAALGILHMADVVPVDMPAPWPLDEAL